MEILKYLDVLIGLAVVMLLLSPLVSGFTQFWLWLCNSRAANLRRGLERILLQLEPDPYEMFEAVEISGLAGGSPVILQQPGGNPAVNPNATPAGSIVLTQNIAPILRESGGNLLAQIHRAGGPVPALQFTPAVAGVAPSIRLWVRGTDPWSITTTPTGASGDATVHYQFTGPAQYASPEFTVNLPADATLAVTIATGDYKGTVVPLNAATGRYVYPANIDPVPASHDLNLVLTNAAGPVPGTVLILNFCRRTAHYPAPPLVVSLSGKEAGKIARDVLRHNMIGQPNFLIEKFKFLGFLGRDQGEVVEREELIRILLEFAANPAGPEHVKLQQILAADGVPWPTRALADIRTVAQQLELTVPAEAAHQRLSKAILTAAQSAFVGKVNTWFDQTMARTSAEYKFRAQVASIVGALAVATCVQLDSIDLLKRLSTDDKLRSALIDEAKNQQARLDSAQKVGNASSQDADEIQFAKASRDEIEANLAKMRDPQLGVLPDHFVWQALPKARLVQNPRWDIASFGKRLELVLGGSLYPIQPIWSRDVLGSIAASIRNSGAPVTLALEHRRSAEVTAQKSKPTVDRLEIQVGGNNALMHTAGPQGDAWRFDDLLFDGEKEGKCRIRLDGKDVPTSKPCTFDTLVKDLGSTFTVTPVNEDHLVLTSHRLGVLQLRSVAGTADTNILNRMLESTRRPFHLSDRYSWFAFDWDLFWSSWRGVLLTWVLLSLGAPFWYESLKNLLQLRSSLAVQEEKARTDRQTTNPPAK
jgi:hypothetical protein